MIETTYTIATPAGVLTANWDDDESIPVSYDGDPDAIAYFRGWLDLTAPSAARGKLVQFDRLEPDDLGFIAVENAPVFVVEPLEQLDDPAEDADDTEPDMTLLLDSANDADVFALIGEGTQLLAGLDENADSFFTDLSRLREIIQSFGESVPVEPQPVPVVEPDLTPPAHTEQFESYRRAIEEAVAAGTLAAMPGLLDQIRTDERLDDGEADELLALAGASHIDPVVVVEPEPIIEPVGLVVEPPQPPEPAPDLYPDPTPVEPAIVDYAALLAPAARSSETLREIDIYRVLVKAPDESRAALAQWIIDQRPDLAPEVVRVLAEEWPELAGQVRSEPAPPVVVDRTDGIAEPLPEGGTTVPPAEGETTEGTAASTPERDADMAFLKAITSGEIDLAANDPYDRIEAIVHTYANDEAMAALAREAIEVYVNDAAHAMTQA